MISRLADLQTNNRVSCVSIILVNNDLVVPGPFQFSGFAAATLSVMIRCKITGRGGSKRKTIIIIISGRIIIIVERRLSTYPCSNNFVSTETRKHGSTEACPTTITCVLFV